MPLQNPEELFAYDLSAMLSAEQQIAQMLPMMAQECRDEQLRQQILHHEQETRQQIQNLQRCCTMLGISPMQVTCYAIQGMQRDHQEFVQQNSSPETLQLFDLGAAMKTEHFEIACYRGMVEKAQTMGQQEIVQLLEENLQQEEKMARKVERIAAQLGSQILQQSSQMAGVNP